MAFSNWFKFGAHFSIRKQWFSNPINSRNQLIAVIKIELNFTAGSEIKWNSFGNLVSVSGLIVVDCWINHCFRIIITVYHLLLINIKLMNLHPNRSIKLIIQNSFIQLKLIQLRHWIHLSFMIEIRIEFEWPVCLLVLSLIAGFIADWLIHLILKLKFD